MEVNDIVAEQGDIRTILIIDTLIVTFCIVTYFLFIKKLKLFQSIPKKGYEFLGIFYVSEDHYKDLSQQYGLEVAIYLWFQKNLIQALGICTILGLAILLPIHLTGNLPKFVRIQFNQSEYKYYQENYLLLKTTASMVILEPSKLYAHVVMAFVFSLIFLIFIYRFKNSSLVMEYSSFSRSLISNYTIKATGVPIDVNLEQYLEGVAKIEYIYENNEKKELERILERINELIEHYTYHNSYLRIGLFQKIDALTYYTYERDLVEDKLRKMTNPKKSDECFIIFKKPNLAQSYLIRKRMEINYKMVEFTEAHEPDDLQYTYISKFQRFIRKCIVYLLLIIIMIFFTTPFSMLSSLQTFIQTIPHFNNFPDLGSYLGSLIYQFIPTFLLFFISFFVTGVLIQYLTQWEGYETITETQRVSSLRIYIYLLFSTLILPSLLLTSLDGIIKYFQHQNLQSALIHMFSIASGAFFISYILQYALLGNTFDLIRIGDSLFHLYKKWVAITPRDHKESYQLPEIDTYTEYAYLISVLSIIMCYSVLSPLILPCGLFLFMYKYVVDRYNAIPTSKSRDYKQIRMVILFTLTNLLLFQVFTLLFMIKTVGFTSNQSILMIVLIMITLYFYGSNYFEKRKGKYDIFLDSSDIYSKISKKEIEMAYSE